MRSLQDVSAWFAQPYIGSSETAAAPWWRLFEAFAPEVKVVVVRRRVDEVVDSLMKLAPQSFDPDRLRSSMTRLDRKLDQVAARVPRVLQVKFEELEQEDACAAVFEHCLTHFRHDPAHWLFLADCNIQCDLRALLRYVGAYAPQMQKLAEIAKHRTIAAMNRRPANDHSGLTFQVDTLEDFLRDGVALFEEHCVTVGESPEEWRRKNIPQMHQAQANGALQIMTARCNGRMFGYLMTFLTPALSNAQETAAVNTTFYAAPDFPGLGLKIQRAAIEALRERGVDRVFMQAGTRGGGERIGALYRRLGAENDGQMFRLELKEA